MSTGAGSASVQYPAFFNNVLGTRFKIVFGYPGGKEIDLAMERGEVEGRGINPYAGYIASEPDWIPGKKIIPLIQVGQEKEPALPDVPLLLDQPVSGFVPRFGAEVRLLAIQKLGDAEITVYVARFDHVLVDNYGHATDYSGAFQSARNTQQQYGSQHHQNVCPIEKKN